MGDEPQVERLRRRLSTQHGSDVVDLAAWKRRRKAARLVGKYGLRLPTAPHKDRGPA